MENQNVIGENFLKITGIIGVVICTILTMAVFAVFALVESSVVPAPEGTVWIIEFAVLYLILVYSFFVYIMGIIHCKNTNKAKLLYNLGIILIITLIASSIYSLIMYDIYITAIIVITIDLIVPILYVVGASKNKKTVELDEPVQRESTLRAT